MGLALQLFFCTHQTSAPHPPPQQNGCAERFNCTLLEKANVMRHHACMPHIFWQDAVQTALHIYNHQPMCRLHWKTPNEMFLSDKPDISYFKIFGTCAYVHIPSDTREDKLSPRAEQMIFIGYHLTQKLTASGAKIVNESMSQPQPYLMKEYFHIVPRRIKMDLDHQFLKISNHISNLLMMNNHPQGNWNLLDTYSSHNHCYPYRSYRYFHNNPINKSHLDQQTGEIQVYIHHPPLIHCHMDNIMILLRFVLTIQMKSHIVGIPRMIFHHPDMNHILDELHPLYPFSGIHPLLHPLENNRLTNLLHIKWSYHLLIRLLEETSLIPVIDLVFRTDIIISNSWLAIIQNAYYWKEMKQMIHLLNTLEKNLHLLLQEHMLHGGYLPPGISLV